MLLNSPVHVLLLSCQIVMYVVFLVLWRGSFDDFFHQSCSLFSYNMTRKPDFYGYYGLQETFQTLPFLVPIN